MSKKKKKKRNPQIKKQKKKSLKPLIAALCITAGVLIVIIASYLIWQNTSLEATDFVNQDWVSVEARDASNDEVNIAEVYNVTYSTYNGKLGLNGDGTFTFWMKPGDESDGTHTGTYTYDRDKEILKMTFDSGDKKDFKIIRGENGTIERIEAPYEEYTIYFITNRG